MNLVEMIGKYVSPEMLSKIGSTAGLGSDESKKVASGAVPLVATGIAQLGSTEEGAGRLLDLARQSGAEDMAGRFGEMIGSDESRRAVEERGGGILSSLFGSKWDGILDLLSTQTGASRTGTQSFLAMLAPLALGVLGRHARNQGLSAGGLSSMLAGQSGLLANMLPGGLGKLLGGGVPGVETREPSRAEAERPREVTPVVQRARVPPVQPRRSGMPAVLGLVGIALVAWALLRGRKPEVQPQATAPETAVSPQTPAAGMQRMAPNQGIDALAAYSGPDLKDQRFSLTDIGFETGTTHLNPPSARQVDQLAVAMRDRAGMKVRLEGERAGPVRDALTTRGIAGDRVMVAPSSAGQGTAERAPSARMVDVVVTEQ